MFKKNIYLNFYRFFVFWKYCYFLFLILKLCVIYMLWSRWYFLVGELYCKERYLFLIEYFKIYFEFLGDRKVFSVLLLSVKLLKLVLIIKVFDFDFWYGRNSIKKYMNINVFLFFFIFIEKYILVFWIKIGGMNFFLIYVVF